MKMSLFAFADTSVPLRLRAEQVGQPRRFQHGRIRADRP